MVNDLHAFCIIVWYDQDGWRAKIDFDDLGDCQNGSVDGTIRTKYAGELTSQIDTILADSKRLGIKIGADKLKPAIFCSGDGNSDDYPPPDGWKELIRAEADRIGFVTYGMDF